MRSLSSAVATEIAKAALATPITLIRIYLNSATLRYADNPTDVSFGGYTYNARSIVHSSIQTHIKERVGACNVQIDNADKAMEALCAAEDFSGKKCEIVKVFAGLTGSTDYVLQFRGYIDTPITDDYWLSFRLTSAYERGEQPIPWPRWLKQCNWRFCHRECGYNPVDDQNLLTYSEQMDHADWTATGVTVVNSAAVNAPNNTTTSDLMTEDSSTGTHGVTQNITGLSDNESLVLSCYMRKKERTWGRLRIRAKTGTLYHAWYNLNQWRGGDRNIWSHGNHHGTEQFLV